MLLSPVLFQGDPPGCIEYRMEKNLDGKKRDGKRMGWKKDGKDGTLRERAL